MADEDKDSKTEKPTEKKLRDTMEKGNVPHSKEATLFASMLATVIYVTFFLPERVGRMGEVLRDLFEKPDQWQLETGSDVISLFIRIGWEVGNLLLPAVVLFFAFGIGSSMFQNLPTPVLDRIAPQFSRISPVAGWGRIFSTSGLVEFGKSLAKIVLVGVIMFFVLRGQFFHAIDSLVSDPQTIFVRLTTIIQKILTIVLLATAVVGIGDVLWTRYHWVDQLKMTKQEVKEEHKQSQGDPIVKSRQRSIARDRARRRMMKQVPRATLVIANPTHFAVALRYVREENDAPIVVAKGQDLIALKIREIAEANGIPVFEDPPLARSMFAQVSVDSVIPSVFYKAVAELIHRIYATQSNRKRVR
ncbi:flagellar biosynthesis protein FlhB [Rhizobium sp. LEGMi198b]|uniref:flagellar biosynthesis protein FlhB n=1 Tax=unclassified Rhizobium TaxID=2613769 RepID=UPI000CDF4F33|nr:MULTISPECIES: flagellar biosynthesis protein FlhB [Rhizobium]AVA20312.1 flagellar biosynthetic protein FlhB [Rhizobium sp. NXC24]MDK4740567.1 flagellar biosynthesis protein FlhB [Rhizobium sp. CNPSo 3464]UWU21604.1 flagellar biosynthesis protein FlhB [Rhizobium tropici]WFU02422.1 flagellar biosynthesis protein FlhB [Rhizobium sp. CB3171]